MDWVQKFETARREANLGHSLAISCAFPEQPASPGFVLSQKDKVPSDYLEFLQVSDGVIIDFYTLGGSMDRGDGIMPLYRVWANWKRCYDKAERFPFGLTPAGSFLCIGKEGSVYRVPSDPMDYNLAEVLAESFGEFMGDFLLGAGFLRHSGLSAEDLDEDESWARFLVRMGWAQ